MDVYLKDEKNNINFHFPVNPMKSLSKGIERRFKTGDIINYGEVDIYKTGENIEEISFDTLFPQEYNESFCKYSTLKDSQSTVNMFEKWVMQEEPLRLIITDININILVNISKFQQTYNAGEIGDVYASITFRRHREIIIDTVNSTISKIGQQLNSRIGETTIYYNKGNKVKVTTSSLNVREGPGTTYKIIGTLSKGKQAEVYQSKNDWIEIYFGNNGGWILANYVTKV